MKLFVVRMPREVVTRVVYHTDRVNPFTGGFTTIFNFRMCSGVRFKTIAVCGICISVVLFVLCKLSLSFRTKCPQSAYKSKSEYRRLGERDFDWLSNRVSGQLMLNSDVGRAFFFLVGNTLPQWYVFYTWRVHVSLRREDGRGFIWEIYFDCIYISHGTRGRRTKRTWDSTVFLRPFRNIMFCYNIILRTVCTFAFKVNEKIKIN